MYGSDETGHRGLSDQQAAEERAACAAVDAAFANLCKALIDARNKTSLRREQLDEAIASIDDIRPDPKAWEETIEEART